jgi:hypothetical protein
VSGSFIAESTSYISFLSYYTDGGCLELYTNNVQSASTNNDHTIVDAACTTIGSGNGTLADMVNDGTITVSSDTTVDLTNYTGIGSLINDGTLAIAVSSTDMANLTNNGSLLISSGTDTFNVANTGSIVISSGANVSLNSYTGSGSLVNNGTLTVTTNVNFGAITNNGTMIVASAVDTWLTNYTSSGSMVIYGVLYVSGSCSVSTITIEPSGALAVYSNVPALNANIIDNGNLDFSTSTEFSGSLSGTGDVWYYQTGTNEVFMAENGGGFTGTFAFYPLGNLGSVQIDSATALGTGGASVGLYSGTLDLNGYSPTFIMLNGNSCPSTITNTSLTTNSIVNLEYNPGTDYCGVLGANVVNGPSATVGINFLNLNPSAGIVEEYIAGNDTYTGPTTVGASCYFTMWASEFYSPITNNGILCFNASCNDYAGIVNNNQISFDSGTSVISGVISGTGCVSVYAPTTFQAMNTYTGGTDIYGGTLTLSGHASIADSYLVSIETGCELIYAENAGFTETETNQLNGAGQIVDNSSPNSTINYQAVDAAFLASGGSFRNNTGNPSALLF